MRFRSYNIFMHLILLDDVFFRSSRHGSTYARLFLSFIRTPVRIIKWQRALWPPCPLMNTAPTGQYGLPRFFVECKRKYLFWARRMVPFLAVLTIHIKPWKNSPAVPAHCLNTCLTYVGAGAEGIWQMLDVSITSAVGKIKHESYSLGLCVLTRWFVVARQGPGFDSQEVQDLTVDEVAGPWSWHSFCSVLWFRVSGNLRDAKCTQREL
jgi:hypothetical protein